TYETRKTVRDSEGHTQTTITRSTAEGRKETITTYDGGDADGGPTTPKPFFGQGPPPPPAASSSSSSLAAALLNLDAAGGRKHLFAQNGYVLPRNLW
ncbi:hypothetical protein pipiens_019753, partial [Culex pipiens pipiens]